VAGHVQGAGEPVHLGSLERAPSRVNFF
jgi:hypothetical protein